MLTDINKLCGIKESDTGLSLPSQWDLVADKRLASQQALQVARCTKIINPNTKNAKYMIAVKQIGKFVVGLGEKVAPTDVDEGMRVGVDRSKYFIQLPLPPKIDPSVTMMTVEEKPDVTYNDIGGCKEQLDKLREVRRARSLCVLRQDQNAQVRPSPSCPPPHSNPLLHSRRADAAGVSSFSFALIA